MNQDDEFKNEFKKINELDIPFNAIEKAVHGLNEPLKPMEKIKVEIEDDWDVLTEEEMWKKSDDRINLHLAETHGREYEEGISRRIVGEMEVESLKRFESKPKKVSMKQLVREVNKTFGSMSKKIIEFKAVEKKKRNQSQVKKKTKKRRSKNKVARKSKRSNR